MSSSTRNDDDERGVTMSKVTLGGAVEGGLLLATAMIVAGPALGECLRPPRPTERSIRTRSRSAGSLPSVGPHQEDTSLEYWRFLSNTIVERKTERLTGALDFHVSTEVVDESGEPRAWWVAVQIPLRFPLRGSWSMTVRPEWAWDSEGRWTTFEQTVTALTTSLEYRASNQWLQAILRLEHRYDHSTGPDGGFFEDVDPGVVGLTPRQHLLILGVILTFDRGV